MIQITKSTTIPTVLTTTGATHRATLEATYDANPASCRVPRNTVLAIDAGIYKHPTVKQQLKQDQYSKCCYCESCFTATSYGDVEHFRPKAGYQQTRSSRLIKPGYYWLAYSWENLYFSCQRCNQQAKKNYFPLLNHSQGRAIDHHHDIAQEQPYLLDLATEDPTPHLTFRDFAAVALTERGQKSINAYDLNRVELLDRRNQHLKNLRNARNLVLVFEDRVPNPRDPVAAAQLAALLSYSSVDELYAAMLEALTSWQQADTDAAEFAGMVRACEDLRYKAA
ncbi:hypothetical protein F1C16_02980 [Hymenobacter sp. NBH84]|uniref:hypothetical protein n=1 Tax=Hymenobacter sp. NBH84 TaxID=2596915 RepID=UPI00162558F3|nr:hypothetical protein [Hymenobacter sp. NBH84]QNE38587.1 hypothetical protein F1C16_02980 [Hymenobacter sp. NBH84]